MEKKEFKQYCHEEFLKRGFVKRKSMYFAKGRDNLLCSLDLQGSCGTCYFINCAIYIDCLVEKGVYPTFYDSDLFARFSVMSKATYKGETFMTGLIEYTKYSKEDLLPYIEKELDTRIMPILKKGKAELLRSLEQWHAEDFSKERLEDIRSKLIQQISEVGSEGTDS